MFLFRTPYTTAEYSIAELILAPRLLSLANNISSVWLVCTGASNPVGSELPSKDINRDVIGCHAYADHGADSLICGKCLVERR